MTALKMILTPFHQVVTISLIPLNTGTAMFFHNQRNTAPIAENTALMTGNTYVWNQATTARTATMIPFQAILMPFHNHLAPATIPFQTACMIGHSTSRNQLPTAETAILMPAHAALTPSRN